MTFPAVFCPKSVSLYMDVIRYLTDYIRKKESVINLPDEKLDETWETWPKGCVYVMIFKGVCFCDFLNKEDALIGKMIVISVIH